MGYPGKTLNLIFICWLIHSCTAEKPPEQTIETSTYYKIELDHNFKVSKYTYYDPNESYSGDNDAISQYFYYQDSIVIIRDGRSVTARGDYLKTIYYLNDAGIADSSLTESAPGHLPNRIGRNFYTYDFNEFLIKDSSIHKEQNGTILSSSVSTYEYSDGNKSKSTVKYIDPYPSTYTYTFTYYNIENLFSLFGSFKGKANKNLVQSTTSSSKNGDKNVTSYDYKLYPNGLIEEENSILYSNSVKYVLKQKYEYIFTD